jgi:hypothetical protein
MLWTEELQKELESYREHLGEIIGCDLQNEALERWAAQLQKLLDGEPKHGTYGGETLEKVAQKIVELVEAKKQLILREPTQAEGDAHEYLHDQSMGPSYGAGECFVPMGNHHGWRCKCGVWVWGSKIVCQQCQR